MGRAADYFLSQFDTAAVIQATLLDPGGKTPINLTGATLRFSIRRANDSVPSGGGVASIVGDPTLGVVSYQWQPVDVATPGMFNAEWIVTFPGSHEMTWPNSTYLRIEIKPRLDPTDTPPTPSPLVGTIAVIVSLDGINTGTQQLVALDTTVLASGTRAWVESVHAYFTLEKTGTAFTPDNISIVAGLNGGQWFRDGFTLPVTADPSVGPGLALPIGSRVHKADGTAAWDKFGPAATNWAGVSNGTDATARAAAATAQTTANLAETHAQTGITNAASAQTTANSALALATTAEADAQTAIALAAAAGGIKRFALVSDLEAYAGTTLDARCADVKDEFYADGASSLTADAITVLNRTGGGRWIRKCQSDLYWQQQSELWLDGSAGSDRSSGARGSPIKTVGEWGRRCAGWQNQAPGTLYTAAALPDAEAALFSYLTGQSPRQWTTVNGSFPVAPKFLFDSRNFNGANNAGITDGQDVSSATWFNGGSVVAGGGVGAGSGMTFRSIASAGKVRNSPSIAFTGSGWFRSAVVAGLTSPITWVTIARVTNGAAANGIVAGRSGANTCEIFTLASLWFVFAGVGAVPGFGGANPVPVGGVYNYLYCSYNTSAAILALNGQIADAPVQDGGNTVDGITIGARGDNSNPLTGEIVLVAGFDTQNVAPDGHMLDQYMQYHFGAGFPQ